MGLFDKNRRRRQQNAARHRDNVSPWEKYAEQDDRIQGDICNHDHYGDHDPWECDH